MKQSVLISLILSNIILYTPIESARILGIIPTPSFSHQIVFRPIWKELAKRGHDLTILTTDPMKETNLTNLREIDLSFTYQLWREKYKMIEQIEANKFKLWKMIQIFVSVLDKIHDAELNHPEVKALIQNQTEHFDLVIAECIHPLMFAFSARFKTPLVGVSSLDISSRYHTRYGNPTHPLIYPDVLLPFEGKLNFFERVLCVLTTAILYFTTISLDEAQNLAWKHFGKETPMLEDISNNISLVLTNVDPAFNKRPLSPMVIPFGGGAHLESPKPLPNDIQEYLDNASNGVIYFSLGTNVNENIITTQMRKVFTNTFRKLSLKVLWKFGVNVSEIPDNVKTVKWVSQQDVLRHPNIKLFITQGGLQSMEEAVYMNIPLICIPFFADQEGNANRIVKRGIGLKLDRHDLTEEKLMAAILEIINNSKYKARMKEISEISKDKLVPGIDEAVFWIEYVLRHKGARHLRSPTLDMPLYQYYLLDVISFLSVLTVILLAFFYTVLKFIYYKFVASKKQKSA